MLMRVLSIGASDLPFDDLFRRNIAPVLTIQLVLAVELTEAVVVLTVATTNQAAVRLALARPLGIPRLVAVAIHACVREAFGVLVIVLVIAALAGVDDERVVAGSLQGSLFSLYESSIQLLRALWQKYRARGEPHSSTAFRRFFHA